MIKYLIDKWAAFGLSIHNKREENRKRLAADRVIKEGVIHGGQVWKHVDGADYQVLFLTNLYTNGSIQVVYTKHWAYIRSMPVEDFLEQFTHNRNIDNSLSSAHEDLMAMATSMRGRDALRTPLADEYWWREDRIPNGFDENRQPVFAPLKVSVKICGTVEQSPAQQFVLYEENNVQRVLNMHQFLNRYRPEVEANVA